MMNFEFRACTLMIKYTSGLAAYVRAVVSNLWEINTMKEKHSLRAAFWKNV